MVTLLTVWHLFSSSLPRSSFVWREGMEAPSSITWCSAPLSLPPPFHLLPSRSASLCRMFPFQKVISWLMHLRFHQKVEPLIRQTDALLGFHWQITIPLIKTMCLYITKLIPAGSLLVLHPDLPRLWILTPCDTGGTKTI